MSFEVFQHKRRVYKDTPLLGIGKAGNFSLNTAAVAKMFEGVEFIVMLYDKEANRMAVKPVRKASEHSYKITGKHNMTMWGGISFLKYYGIDYSKTRKYLLTWDEELKAAVADLNASYTK
jgi:hypothetical protein